MLQITYHPKGSVSKFRNVFFGKNVSEIPIKIVTFQTLDKFFSFSDVTRRSLNITFEIFDIIAPTKKNRGKRFYPNYADVCPHHNLQTLHGHEKKFRPELRVKTKKRHSL